MINREFNVTGLCVSDMHYMADTSDKISQIMQLVEQGAYFTINRGRQYGKTTTLFLLEKQMAPEYVVISISFEAASIKMFNTESDFCIDFLDLCATALERSGLPSEAEIWKDNSVTSFNLLSNFLTKTCRDKKYVLMIDEVDKSSNNSLFLNFLGILRDKYLLRNQKKDFTFQSVILAGVYDIKNLKYKMVLAGTHKLQEGENRQNSPWNIAIDFEVDMSLSAKEISSMLTEYEKDYNTGMNIGEIASEIHKFTNGYPFLVSRICQHIDKRLNKDWTIQGVNNAAKKVIDEKNMLADDLSKNMESYPDLKKLLWDLTVGERNVSFSSINPTVELAVTFGIVEQRNGLVAIHNRIFETTIINYFATEKELRESRFMRRTSKDEIIENNCLNMELLIRRFANHYYEVYSGKNVDFLENECRVLFITYLRAIINGVGFYHIESEIRENRRTDVIVDYLDKQFIIELKLWYGETAHEKAYAQLANYLNSKNEDTGYMVTFDFRKENNVGKPQIDWRKYNGKEIFDVIVGF